MRSQSEMENPESPYNCQRQHSMRLRSSKIVDEKLSHLQDIKKSVKIHSQTSDNSADRQSENFIFSKNQHKKMSQLVHQMPSVEIQKNISTTDKMKETLNKSIQLNKNDAKIIMAEQHVSLTDQLNSIKPQIIDMNLRNEIKNLINSLNKNYIKLDQIIAQEKDQSSKYYHNDTKQLFSHFQTKYWSIPQSYSYNYEENVDIPAVYETRVTQVLKTKTIKKKKIVKQTRKYTTYERRKKWKTQTYTDWETVRRGGISSFLYLPFFKQVPVQKTRRVCKWQDVPVQKEYQVQRQVEYDDHQPYWDNEYSRCLVTPARTETQTRTGYGTRYVQKSLQVPVYTTVSYRKFDQNIYNKDIKNCQQKIESLRNEIKQSIQKYPKNHHNFNSQKKPVKIKGIYEKKYKDLLQQWRDAEYNAYGVNFSE